MIITKIEPQKNIERVNIYIDGEFAFGLMQDIQYKYGLSENMEIDSSFIDEVLIEEEKQKANNVALKFLGYRQRSTKEIVDKLKKKDFSDSIIDSTLDYLKGYNLINDLEFAKSFVKDKKNLNKYGPQKIKYELYNKGISKDIVDEVLDEYDDEYNIAMELAIKKMKSYKDDDKNAIYRKLGGYLSRKGFSYDCVLKILKEIIE